MPRCAGCHRELVHRVDQIAYRDEFVFHRACLSLPAKVVTQLENAAIAVDTAEQRLAQANKNARAMIDRAHEIEKRATETSASTLARLADLELELARERSRRAALEAELEIANRLPREDPIPTPEKDALIVRASLLELD